jgi:adenine-specific DNA-methyltransferase
MAARRKAGKGGKRSKSAGDRPIEQYEHKGKQRANNPPVGLVNPQNDPDAGKKTWAYDPHLDPQLVWTGKAEHTSFEVPTVSLHVHERIDPKTIVEAVRRPAGEPEPEQISLFAQPGENPPLRDALDFYRHPHGWSNRLVAGDSLRYGSNFQPFVNRRDVKDGKDEDLTQEPEMIRAFRDTWELGIHSYLGYLRDRLLLARELLSESGSVFVQIGDENLHRVRCVMDEVLGAANFRAVVSARKTAGLGAEGLVNVADYLLWYAKDLTKLKTRTLYEDQDFSEDPNYAWIMNSEGSRRRLGDEERESGVAPTDGRLFRHQIFLAAGRTASCIYEIEFGGERFLPTAGRSWSTNAEGTERLKAAKRLVKYGNQITYVRYASDFPLIPLRNIWEDTASGVGMRKIYVVQTTTKIVQRCLLMTTDPGDLVFDPTCGSGTTAYVAEQWGRRWITCDTSRVALTLAKQRLMTAVYDYYELAHPEEGVGSGFRYKTVPHVTLKSIANNPEIKEGMSRAQIDAAIAKYADEETLYDQPYVDKSRARVAGPFTVEAVPAPVVQPLGDAPATREADASAARSGETLRQAEWRDELLRTGIRAKNGQMILFSRVEPLAGTRFLHAEAETKPNDRGADRVSEGKAPAWGKPQRVVISFGPEHAPLEQRQVARAFEEASQLAPKPALVVFAAFQFDPEAAKDIDELGPEKTGMTFLKVQMNPDLLTEDLKKARASNESFWLVGQPDVELRRVAKGDAKGLYEVEVRGFDYYNTKSGAIESGSAEKIAVWMLDPDYDGRSLFPRQVFFPMAGDGEGWARLARSLRAEIDEERIEAYRGTVSLPFAAGSHKRIAVKVVDDRGIESLRILELE